MDKNMDEVQASIIMPALNEEENISGAISDTLQAFDDYCIHGEIIVINDGSSDKTLEIVEKIRETEKRVSVISHASPQGVGASFWQGVSKAKGDVVSMFPGDGENDPWEALRYIRLLDHVDIVIPFVYNREVRPLFRNALSYVYRFIINTTFFVNFNYTNGTVLYRKALLEEMTHHSTGFFFQTDILIRTVKKGYLFAEVPYRLGVRGRGDSKAVSFPSFLKVVKGYLKLLKDSYYIRKADKEDFLKNTQTSRRYCEYKKNEPENDKVISR